MNRYINYLNLINKICDSQIDNIGNIRKLLCTDIWNLAVLSDFKKLERVLGIIFCDTITIEECPDSKKSNYVAVEITYPHAAPRKDNKRIFDNLYNYLLPAEHYNIIKTPKFNLRNAGKKIKLLKSYKKHFTKLSNIDASFLSAQLLIANELVEKCSFVKDKKILLIFQEDDLISSTIIQAAQRKGVCVVTPQHGMPMNRHEDIDQLHFDGFLADHKLLWNEATKEQFLSAGIDESSLEVVGNTKKIDDSDDVSSVPYNGVLGIIFDCPDYEYALDANKKMVSLARALMKKSDLKLLVKLHPRDHVEVYKDILSNEEILPTGTSMEEYESKVSISIGHTTGAIFDLIYDGKIVFQYKDDKKFPVMTMEECKFSNENELEKSFQQWADDWDNLYRTYIEEVVPNYHVKNARKLHDEFFKKLFAEVG